MHQMTNSSYSNTVAHHAQESVDEITNRSKIINVFWCPTETLSVQATVHDFPRVNRRVLACNFEADEFFELKEQRRAVVRSQRAPFFGSN